MAQPVMEFCFTAVLKHPAHNDFVFLRFDPESPVLHFFALGEMFKHVLC